MFPPLPDTLACLPLDYDHDGDLDLLFLMEREGHVRLLRNEGGNDAHWLRLTAYARAFAGTNDSSAQANNSYAVGMTLEVRAGNDYQQVQITGPATLVGLGEHERAAIVRVTWNHGIHDNYSLASPRLGLAANASYHEEQLPRGSCPVLYAWDGSRYVMVSDCNWRSPLGMLFARGAPIPHHLTRDWLKVSDELLRPNEGVYHLVITEELREAHYLDWAELAVVDHPDDVEFYVDERLRLGDEAPFVLHTVRQPRQPIAATTGDGRDLLAAIATRDGVYTEGVPPSKYRGLAPRHELILDLGPLPDPRDVRLFLTGYVYPGGTSVNIAASQDSTMDVGPTTFSVADGRGGWQVVDGNVGMPSGRDKTIVLEIPGGFPSEDHRVSLATSMELRWDVAFFTSGEASAPTEIRRLPVASAELAYHGFARFSTRGENGPVWYDFENVFPRPLYPPIPGVYTRYGEVGALLQATDDRFIMQAAGDAVQMSFDGRALPPPRPGWKRQFVFLSDGWTKDSDPNTVTADAVAPLPFHGMQRYPYGGDERFPDTEAHRRWQAEYNTRRVGGDPANLASPAPPLRQ